ncbi:hypothetical protein CCM_02122 [Cordyceps militaris CM01]|uniref:Uncharacterized protein n=2 Tax=Cordyceps militaris TaxID=73501 RepID=G3JCP0_CORMM|nr:uncharacterized protein CCM_02122 [Cordyceps militaris CM01]ATY60537.1 hypothetical protein A9K55_006778 [Cordyceps militaris]EGX93852.1 hypothetical protein CCM_02122 [Cordyceps militaris CM01]
MTTPAPETTVISEQPSDDVAPQAVEISEEVFNGPITLETVYVKWDVDNGRDRPVNVPMSTGTPLDGSPKIQGIEIKAGQNVRLNAWADTWANGNPSLGVDGPTNGKIKVDPKRRLGFYIVDPR